MRDRESDDLDYLFFALPIVVLVPKSSLLSIRTTSLNPHIPTNLIFSREATSGTLLTLILLHEMMLGKMGPWWGYLQSLPCNNGHWGIPLPMSLKKDSKEWKFVSQSEAGRMIKRAEADPMGRIEGFGMSLVSLHQIYFRVLLSADTFTSFQPRLHHFFKTKGLPILKKAHVHLLSVQSKDREKALFQDFVRAHSIISSRTFIVDMYHGMCLVPIADMFNHSEHANVHFEADDEVCDDCGSLGACPHNDDPLPSEAYGRPSSILPAETGPNSKDWIPPIQLVGVDMVEMVAQRELDCEEEAYNTYGNFSNATLLTTYGFCLEYETEWERYVWEWRYKEERDELLDAVSYSSMLRTTRNSEGEGFQQEQRSKWVKVCSQFCNLPQTSFSELLDDSYAIRQASFSKVEEKIGLPISSPFVPLTQSSKQEGEEMTLNGKLENVIAPLSTHDGSKDMYQPLFIDSQGRISTSLWRFALLWTISVERDGKDFVNGTELVRRCVQATEELLDSVLEGGQSQFQKDSDYRILQKTLLILQKLIESRLKAIEASRQMYSEIDNLSMLEVKRKSL